MSFLRRPDGQFALGLLLLTMVGAVLLAQPAALTPSEQDLAYFGSRRLWRATFDALSAACGVGLLSNDFTTAYTDWGRWALTAIGLLGAILYLATTLRIARKFSVGQPRAAAALVVFAFLLLASVAAGGLAHWAVRGAPAWSDVSWSVLAAQASLGWPLPQNTPLTAWTCAAAAWLSGSAASVWLASLFAAPNRGTRLAQWLLAALGYSALLLLLAGVICALEAPRGAAQPSPTPLALSDSPLGQRFVRSANVVTLASGSGMPVAHVQEGGLRDGSKALLAVVVLVGGLDGALDGGLKLPMLLTALSAAGWALGRADRSADQPAVIRWHAVALASVFWLLLLTLLCAGGLLLIENLTASRFQPAPTFADALLDAAAAVGGAGLSSGLTATVTSPNLTSGLGLGLNLYQWGMTWLMLFMFVGRVLPVALLRRATE